jgi:Predicted integral membrane protein
MQDILVEQNIIITEPCKTLRTLGRNALAGKWKTAIITVCIYVLVMQLPTAVFDALFGKNVGSFMTNSGYTYGMDADFYVSLYNNMPQTSALSGLYVLLVSGAMELGLTLYFLATFRKHAVEPADVFLGFERFGKALGLFLFQTLFIFLWTLLFIIPGIIASFRYSQAFFILADDPDKGIRQCMNESKAMMKGNKAKYFLLSLSFIGWGLLALIPAGIIQSLGSVISNNAFIIALFSIIGSLFAAPVIAYMFSTFSGFYEILAGHLIKETMPVPVTAEEARQQYEEIHANDEEPAEVKEENVEEKKNEVTDENKDESKEQ